MLPPKRNDKLTPLNQAVNNARQAVTIAVVFSFFINILALVSPIYMLQVYDRVLTSRNQLTLTFITLIVIFLFVVYAALEVLRTQVLVRAGIGFDTDMREKTFRAVLDSTLQRKGGDAQAFRDVDQVREFMTGAGLIAFCDAPWIPVFVIVSFILHWYFGLLAIISGLMILGLAILNDRSTRAPLQQATIASIQAQNDVAATLRNSEVMRAMGMWKGLQARWQDRRDDLIAWQASASDRGGLAISSIKFLRQVVQTLILGGGAFLAITGKLSPGAMIAASIIVGRALAPIEQGVGQWKTFVGARSAWDRLQTLFRTIDDVGEKMSLPPPKGRITAESAAVAPPGAPRPVVINASFTIEPGTTIGIIGPSAAGKSTLVRGLVGVWPIVMGSIRLDGFDIRQWDPQDLGQHIGYLPQDVELFAGTVAQNIARFTDYDSEDVIEAARIAGVHEVIQQLPQGYDTQIGDAGATLSGGQRQRLALARTIFRKPALIVMDEPNANLDSEGEAALSRAVTHLKELGRTIVFVTHKTNLLAFADQIMVMQGGTVGRIGPRDEIINMLVANSRAQGPQVAGPGGGAPAGAPSAAAPAAPSTAGITPVAVRPNPGAAG
jgi:PrtD family type I secretion system ABC transporter